MQFIPTVMDIVSSLSLLMKTASFGSGVSAIYMAIAAEDPLNYSRT